MKKLACLLETVLLCAVGAGAALGQTYTVLYNLGSATGDPAFPQQAGTIAQGRDGNLYSTANGGAINDQGAAFKITPSGSFTVIHSFQSAEGVAPSGGLTLGTDGNFYGTTSGGGFQKGTVFKMTSGGSLTTLYSFTGGNDGQNPLAAPIQGTDGNFYGTTSNAGNGFLGSVYKITPSGTFTTLKTLDFSSGGAPQAPLVQATNGIFYSTTEAGASTNDGDVFKITASGVFTDVFTFDATHGANPFAPLIQGNDGNFYGTTANGGANSSGEVFKMTPGGVITVLHSFTAAGDGAYVRAGLVQASDGNLYGATAQATGNSGCGTLFRISPSGQNFATLFTFPSDGSMGCNPYVTLTQHTNGILYGDTDLGGNTVGTSACQFGCGVIFSLNANLKAFVALLPYSGKVGKTIEVLGQGFNSSTTVAFNGTPSTPTIVSSTYLTVTVPAGAKTGFVTVATTSGTLTSNKKFLVTPQITSFNPTSGSVGTSVVITGISLSQATRVAFGGVAATTFTVNSDSQVTATVPTGAKTGKITITTPGGTANSATNFTVI